VSLASTSRLQAAFEVLDRYQQRHPVLGLPVAVRRKYRDDECNRLAATLSYYAFFSLFPLLLVGTTVLGFLLQGNPSLEQRIVDTTLAQIPVIGPELKVGTLSGSTPALVVGLVIALWSGTSVFLAAESAMNRLWGVPIRMRANLLRARLHALVIVLVLGAAALCATALSFLGTFGSSFAGLWRAGSLALSTLLAFGLFWVAFRTLTAADVGWRDTWVGAVVAAVLYQGLQALGSYYVDRVVQDASAVYGTFAVVIGLLSWIYIGAALTLHAAELNVVTRRHLWPRSLSVENGTQPTETRAS
jgi:YihY family inner membrane protein